MVKKIIILCGILPLAAGTLRAEHKKQPNIVLINIDDLGWTDLSFNGSTYYETPNIDQLRAKGVWFSEAYSGAANSAPSRASMLTGMYVPRHGMFTVGEADRGKAEHRKFVSIVNRTELEDGIQMLPQVLKNAGYQTCHIGKWHVTLDPTRNGMEKNIAGNNAGHPKSYFAPYHNKDLKDGEKGEFLMNRLGDEAVEHLRNVSKEKPFFLYYAPYEVHAPHQAEAHLIEKYTQKKCTEAHFKPTYAAMLEAMDRNVGKVLDCIREMGVEKQTLIVFTSDNGGLYSASRQWPLRAGKGSFYEGGIRVPLILYQKGRIEKKTVEHVPALQMDLFPTFLELAGISAEELLLDGKSLLPLLSDKTEAYAGRPLFWNFPGYLEGGNKETHDPIFRTTPVSVVRKGDWKLIQYYETGEVELFNIRKDLSEEQDVSKTYPSKTKEMLNTLSLWKKEVHAPIPTELNPRYCP